MNHSRPCSRLVASKPRRLGFGWACLAGRSGCVGWRDGFLLHVLTKLGKCLLVLALVLSVGGHWAIIQGVAWTTMLAQYANSMPLAQALQYTFDGKHPCKLCTAVQRGRAEEKKQDQQKANPGGKLDLGLIWQPVEFYFASPRQFISAPDFYVPSRTEEPPKPRPRGIFPDNQTRV